jgi:hypothetical protein
MCGRSRTILAGHSARTAACECSRRAAAIRNVGYSGHVPKPPCAAWQAAPGPGKRVAGWERTRPALTGSWPHDHSGTWNTLRGQKSARSTCLWFCLSHESALYVRSTRAPGHCATVSIVHREIGLTPALESLACGTDRSTAGRDRATHRLAGCSPALPLQRDWYLKTFPEVSWRSQL